MANDVRPFIYEFKDAKALANPCMDYPPQGVDNDTPLIIDNGSYQFRAGWGINSDPVLIFKNVIARNRGNRKDREWDVLIGNDISDLEAVRWMIRTAFDFNVVVNFSIQESVFDHAFAHLGINTQGGVYHPVVITEPLANLAYSRRQMSELLFEAYDIPKLAYGIDSSFSYEHNKELRSLGENSLIISSGFQSTHVIPVLNGKPDLNGCKRINLGGYNNGAYLQRLLQLKYPKQSSLKMFTLTRMDEILREFGRIPVNYIAEVEKWKRKKFRAANTIFLKVPESTLPTGGQGSSPPSEKILSLGRKLRQVEYKLYDFECVMELEHENPEAFAKAMTDLGCIDEEEMKRKIEKWQAKIEKIQDEINSYSLYPDPVTEVPITTEKLQALEILFKPSLVGYEQAGLGEVMESTFALYSTEQQEEMAKNVLITGGNTQYSGFKERIEAELVKCRPFDSKCRVYMAQNPSLDAWKGARLWATSNMEHLEYWMTRQDFEENGWDYLKDHKASNIFFQPVLGQL